VSILPRLQKRKSNGVYYCRVVVPHKLQHIVGKHEIYTSLKTANLAEAKERLRIESYRIDQMLAKASGRSLGEIQPMSLPLAYATAMPDNSPITFNELVERFFSLPEKAKMTERSKLGYRVTFRILTELMGADTPIHTIRRVDCRRVQEVFAILPANSTKRFPGLSVVQIVEKAKKLKLEPMNPVSANTYIMRLSSMMGWAAREGLIASNPAQRLLLPETDAAKDKRLPFTIDELNSIFSHEKMLHHQRSNDAAFWIPMLSLWTGARLNELCQLNVSDIQTFGSIHCVAIVSDEERRLKTANSQRVIPLHPQLIELGFMEYVAAMRKAESIKLFTALKPGSKGSRSDKFSKDFARYLQKIEVKHAKNCFHSFRHNFRDALREAGTEREIVQALGGWKDKTGGVEDNYGRGYVVERLYDAICKIDYKLQ
jgi:integrase